MSASLQCENSFTNDAQLLYHPFTPKLLSRCRAGAVKLQWNWAVLWLCWAMASANCAQPQPSTPLCSWGRVQREEPAWGPSWVWRAQSKQRQPSGALRHGSICPADCQSLSWVGQFQCFALPSSSIGLQWWESGKLVLANETLLCYWSCIMCVI